MLAPGVGRTVTGVSGYETQRWSGPVAARLVPGRLVLRSGQIRRIARTVSVAVRACRRLGACGHGHIADSVATANLVRCCLHRSESIWKGRQERTVKPSAQPTLVRTQHLPLPAKTAPGLRKRGPAARFLLVTSCIRVCHRGSMRSSGYGHIADSVRAERAVRITARFADLCPFCRITRALDCSSDWCMPRISATGSWPSGPHAEAARRPCIEGRPFTGSPSATSARNTTCRQPRTATPRRRHAHLVRNRHAARCIHRNRQRLAPRWTHHRTPLQQGHQSRWYGPRTRRNLWDVGVGCLGSPRSMRAPTRASTSCWPGIS
jgi:hypothetical protein